MWRYPAYAALGLLTAALLAAPFWLGSYVLHVLMLAFLAVVLGVSYRLLLLGGQASFCHGAFYGIGGYVTAILALRYQIDVWLLTVPAALAAGFCALVLGAISLRTKGPYFFLMTFGFLMVFDSFVSNAQRLTGGYSGLANIPPPFGIGTQWQFYYVILAVTAAIVGLFAYLERTVFGLQIRAIGQSDQLAEALGVSRARSLIAAFVVGAAAAGLGGTFYASYITFVSPNSFSMWVSINALTYSIVGGFDTLLGPTLGAASVTLVPLAFDWSAELVQTLVAASIVAIMMFFPAGLEGIVRRFAPALLEAGPERTRSAGTPPHSPVQRSSAPEPSPGRQPLLEVRDLRFGFGGIRIADGISLEVAEGEVVGLIGPNGAGKSTIFNLLSGVLRPESGSIRLAGEEIAGRPPAAVARSGLVRTFQSTSVFDGLSVFDNVLVAALRAEAEQRPLGSWRPRTTLGGAYEAAEHCLSLVRLGHLREAKARDLPYGAKKMLGLAMALAARPRMLCLDEPVTGLTGHEVQEFIDTIRRLKSEHDITILLVEHRMPVVMQLCDRVYALYSGHICAEGKPLEVANDETVQRIYLGEAGRKRRA